MSSRLPSRRAAIIALGLMMLTAVLPPALAADATGFVKQTGDALISTINSSGDAAGRRQRMQQLVDQAVDVDGIAKFCLGRFWRSATPQQQHDYTTLFHEVLLNNVTGKLGDYRGVRFTIGRAIPRGDGTAVQTTLLRPNAAPTQVEWLIADVGGAMKIEDMVAEGTSLRVTQRSDYASFLQHNGGNVQALIDAMRRQLAQLRG
jgi:phospholipid transport system substrate-binding protein